MRLPLLSIRKYNSSNSAKAHSRTFYILTHFIQIYSTFVRQNPAESQSSDLIRKKVFSNKKCFEGFFFSVITVSSTWGGQCRLWEGFLRKYQMSCWFMFLYSVCPSLSSIHIIYILYNTAFSIINIKAAPDRSGLICLFILFRYDLCCSIT